MNLSKRTFYKYNLKCIILYVCMRFCMYVHVPCLCFVALEDVGAFAAGIAGNYECPMWVLGTAPGASARIAMLLTTELLL